MTTATDAHPDAARPLAKAAMTLMWSSGYIVGALATRHAPALATTFWRLAAAAPLMALLATATGARWPERRQLLPVVAVGVLLQAVQFGGIYLALERGVPAGLTALLGGSSPLLVAVGAALLFDERLARRQWVGSAIGLAGVILAVAAEMRGSVTASGLALALVGLAGLTGGTLVQRRYGGPVDPHSAVAIQLAVAAAVLAPVAALTQGLAVPLDTATLAPLAWLVLGLSIGAMLLYFWLLKHEKGGQAVSFLYLVPAVTAIAAVPVLGQPLSVGAVAGLALALAGVWMVNATRLPAPMRALGRDGAAGALLRRT